MLQKNLSTREAGVIVIGAGAAGLMASIVAAEAGGQVVLLEKNATPGQKLSITGGGRCNITNNTESVRALLSVYKDAGKFLFSPFSQLDVPATRVWLADHGIPTVEEAERRVFPVSQSAKQVTQALMTAARVAGVHIITKSPVLNCTKRGVQFSLTTPLGTWHTPQVIMATGGTSRPETGSTGDALPWLTNFGHTINVPQMSLVPVTVVEVATVARMAGVALADAGIAVRQSGDLVVRTRGKVLFTHVGLSGPGILNLSSTIRDALLQGTVMIELDIVPTMATDIVEATLLSLCIASPNKLVRNQLTNVIPGALISAVMAQAGVLETAVSHSLLVAERKHLVHAIKNLTFTIKGLLGSDKAVVTSGGVALPEIDFRTMESRLIPGLRIVGDVLDIDRPSGGYSLQLCWTTAYVAGRHAVLPPASGSKRTQNNKQK